MNLPEVPESIPRGAVLAILREIGIDPKWCLSLELKGDGLYAETVARDAEGRKVVLLDEVATHRVYIPFV